MTARGLHGPVVALTGTPGTGKTTVADLLRARGLPVLDLKRYIGDPRFDEGADQEHHDAVILDEEALADHLYDHLLEELGLGAEHKGPVFIESHFAHDLDLTDRILVLRCRPSVLQQRLEGRSWPKEKVQENVEAEAMDLILQEALLARDAALEEDVALAVGEIDTTTQDAAAVADLVEGLATADPLKLEIGTTDWSDEVLGWY